ncbi:7132_t:CDS:2, partial [Entrophospora sp. SA101]
DRVYTDRSEGYLERDYNRPEYDYSLRRRQWSASPRKDNNNNSFEYSTSRGGGGYYREEAKSTSPNRYYYNNRSVATATADYDERYHARHPEQDF